MKVVAFSILLSFLNPIANADETRLTLPASSVNASELEMELDSYPEPMSTTKSELFNLPAPKKSSMQVQYGISRSNYSETVRKQDNHPAPLKIDRSAQEYSFLYKYGLPRDYVVSLATGYTSSNYTVDGSSRSQAQGLRDLDLGFRSVAKRPGMNLISGVNVLYSPEPGRFPTQNISGNSFSGQKAIEPTFGLETTLNGANTGFRLAAKFVLEQQTYDAFGHYNTHYVAPAYSGEGFYEFRVTPIAMLGISVGNEQSIGGQSVPDIYKAKAYSAITPFKDTLFNINLEADSAVGNNSTTIGVGIRRDM